MPVRGIALTENQPLSDQLPFIRYAADLGYDSAWTNETRSRDGFMTCQARAAAAPALVTGIGVIPVLHRLPVAVAAQTATLAELTGGKFILGVGVASLEGYRRAYGIQAKSALGLMRDYIA
ncbi:MAG: LLM class flavin-dependent oxidoreductase, partial [Chloroflexota bacterium]